MISENRRILFQCVLAGVFALMLVGGALFIPQLSVLFSSEPETAVAYEWVEQTGVGVAAPACASGSASATCNANGTASVTIEWDFIAGHNVDRCQGGQVFFDGNFVTGFNYFDNQCDGTWTTNNVAPNTSHSWRVRWDCYYTDQEGRTKVDNSCESASGTITTPDCRPACSNKGDDDGDGRIDSADPACHFDFNPDHDASYTPDRNSEEGEPECVDNVDNDGDGTRDSEDPSCHTDNDATNPDSYEPLIPSEDDIAIQAAPAIVREGDTTVIMWTVEGTPDSCVVSGPGISVDTTTSGSEETGELIEESFFTLTCTYGGFDRTATARVVVLPSFEEF